MYLLDADVFIESKKREYGFDICPAYWDWLIESHAAGLVCSVAKVKAELMARTDELSAWAMANAGIFQEPTTAFPDSLRALTLWVEARTPRYQPNAIATFLEDAADSYVVAHAHAIGATIVTRERKADKVNIIKIPDAADGLRVTCVDPWTMLRECGARFVLERP